MWLARICSGVEYCSMLLLYARSMSAAGTTIFARMRVDVDQQVADLALLGNLEVVLVRVEVARDLGVAAVTCERNVVGGER